VEAGRNEHERLRQIVNDDRRRRLGDTDRLMTFMCECGQATCHQTVLLSPEEYDALRPGPIIHLAHTPPR
jgi:hypothetical protein